MLTQEIVSFITVLVVAVCVACSISVLYASAVCFAACVAIVLFALWLMIPMFH